MIQKTRFSRKYARLLEVLREARETAGLKQADVARRFGAHASFVSKCESGERRIDVVELAEFCRIYGIPLGEFLRQAGLER